MTEAANLHHCDEKLVELNDVNKQARKFCFTSFHESPPTFTDNMKYLLYAPETCPTTGRTHWQGYVIYKNKKTRNAVRKELKSWAVATNGTMDDNIAYIKGPYSKNGKEKPMNNNAVEHGELDTQGLSTQTKHYFDEIRSLKRRVSDILEDDPISYHQYGRTMLALEDLHDRDRIRTPAKLYFIHNDDLHKWPHTDCWWMDSHWADDYEHQPTIFINAQRTHWTKNDIKNLARGHPFHMDRKNRSRISLTATTFVFYSQYTIDQTWKNIQWILTGTCWANWPEIVESVLHSQSQ